MAIPLHRRIKAWRRRAVGFLFWLGCAILTVVLYATEATGMPAQAIALSPSADMRAPEAGRLAELSVTLGQRVEAGAALARIELPGVQQEIAAMTAELDALRATGTIEDAERARRAARDRDATRARWLSATVALREAEAELAGLTLLHDRVNTPGLALPAAEVDAANARWDAARAAVTARQAEVADLRRAMDSASGRAGLDLPAAVETQADALRLRIESLQAIQESATLRAPISGVVLGPLSEAPAAGQPGVELPSVGAWLAAGAPVLRVQATTSSAAVAWLDPAQAVALQSGQAVTLRTAAGEITATVQSVGPGLQPLPARLQVDPQRAEWRMPVLLSASSAALLPGEVVLARF